MQEINQEKLEMEQLNWELFYLKDNPFMVMPPSDSESLVWAGMQEVKQKLEQTLTAAQVTATTQVVLNRGPFGGGKTHAMQYFSFSENLPETNNGVSKTFVLSVATPKQTGKPADDFYVDVIERMDIEQLKNTVRQAVEEVGADNALNRLKEITGSGTLARAICLLGQPEQENGANKKLFDDRTEQDRLLDQYFLSGCTKQDLRKLGLARNIEKSQDKFRVLAGLISCFIGLKNNRSVADHSRFCLWIDEMEDFVYFTATQYRPFTQGLRDLIDKLPAFFTLLLNFTLTDPEEFETLEIIMGKALVDRVTDNIIFQEMTLAQGVTYVEELLSFWRLDNANGKKLSAQYPFEKDALEYIINNLDKRTPRALNKRCSSIAEKVLLERSNNTKPGELKIDLEFVKNFLSNELRQELD